MLLCTKVFTIFLKVVEACLMLRQDMPSLRVRMINVVDLLQLESTRLGDDRQPALDDAQFAALFTRYAFATTVHPVCIIYVYMQM